MAPILDCLREKGDSANASEVVEWVGVKFAISDEQREERQKNNVKKFYNQVAWAKQELTWEGLIDASNRGVWALTEKGRATVLTHDASLAIQRKWGQIHREQKSRTGGDEKPKEQSTAIDEEAVDDAETAPAIQETAGEDLLEVLLSLTPSGFERICMRMMRESGFQKVEVTGKSHDQGIDGIGILLINRFVTIKVVFQCKRYSASVGRPQVAEFRNSVMGRAEKGLIITTGTFTSEAIREATRDGVIPIELVDGEKLVKMFEELELGVKPKTIYEVDHAFFEPFKTDGPKPKK